MLRGLVRGCGPVQQPDGKYVGWMDALNNFAEGDYIKKPMMECTGKEICEELLL